MTSTKLSVIKVHVQPNALLANDTLRIQSLHFTDCILVLLSIA